MFKRRKPKVTKDEVWSGVAVAVGASPVLDRKGRSIKQIRLNTGTWTVVLDTTTESTGESTQVYTRYRALYTAKDDFRFRVYRRSVFSDLGKFFGMQDITVGHPKVDPDWIIKSNSEGRIRSLMILPGVIDCLSLVKSARFESRKHKRSVPDVRELRCMMSGVATDPAVLTAGFTMMTEALNQLVRMGSATGTGAGVELK